MGLIRIKMELKNVIRQKGYKRFRRDSDLVRVHVSLFKDESEWLKQKNISPTAILIQGMKELGYKQMEGEEKWKEKKNMLEKE